MSSALIKDYTPPVPPRAPRPPVAPIPPHSETYIEHRTDCYPGTLYTIYDPVTGEPIGFGYLPGFCTTHDVPVTVDYPGSPGDTGDPGDPGSLADYHLGWNSGANSVANLTGNGRYRFSVPSTVYGVITGFGQTATPGATAAVTHGFYCAGGAVRVIEAGAEIGAAYPLTSIDVLSVWRIGTKVFYAINTTRIYESTKPLPGTIWANAALFRGQDSIVDAAFDTLDGGWADASGGFAGVLGNLEGYLSPTGDTALVGRLGVLVGDYAASADYLRGTLGRLKPSMGGGGLAAILEGELGQLTSDWTQAMLLPTVGELYSILPGIAGFFVGLVGNAGGFEGVLGNLGGYFTNVGYAVMQGDLGQLEAQWGTPNWIQPTTMRTQFTMACGIEVQRAAHADFATRFAMTTRLEVTRVLSANMTMQAAMAVGLQVRRTLAAAFAAEATLAATAEVSRALRGDIAGRASMAAGLQVTRTLAPRFASVATLRCALRVRREITEEPTDIIVSPNPAEGVIVRDDNEDVEITDGTTLS